VQPTLFIVQSLKVILPHITFGYHGGSPTAVQAW